MNIAANIIAKMRELREQALARIAEAAEWKAAAEIHQLTINALRTRVAELEQEKARLCPQCKEPLITPRDSKPYCENCGYPDENRPSPLVDNITDAVMAVVSPEGYDAEEREQIRAAIDNAIKNEQR